MSLPTFGDGTISTSAVSNHRGLLKLMLRLPAMRGTLQMLNARSDGMRSLCEAFDDATATYDILMKAGVTRNQQLIEEYEGIIKDLEAEVIRDCLNYVAK